MNRRLAAFGAAAVLLAAAVQSTDAAPDSILDSLPLTQPAGGEREGAGLAVIDVTGIPSMDGLGSPNNVVIFLWIGPFNYVTGSGWDVVLQTLVVGSRLRDITIAVRDTNNGPFSGFAVQPGQVDPVPGGPTAYSSDGIVKLAPQGIPPVQALADGQIRLEFFDSPNNAPNQADGLWVSGTISIQTAFAIPPIPSVSTFALLAVAGFARIARKRARGMEP